MILSKAILLWWLQNDDLPTFRLLPHLPVGTWHSITSKSPPVFTIDFFIHLFSVRMDSWALFSLLFYNSLLSLILVVKLSLNWPLRIPLNWPLHLSDILYYCWFLLFVVFSILLLSGITRYSRFILYLLASALESAISPRSPGSFYWRMALENKIRALGVLIATGMPLLLALFSGQS